MTKPRPYRDYIAWLGRQDEGEAERFWREELKGISEATTLGIDQGAVIAMEGGIEEHAEQQMRLSEELTAQLQGLARQEKITLNTIVQGAWALLLSRYSGESRVVFGTTVSGRPAQLPGVETMIGVFINTVPLSVEVDESEEIVSWLKQIQQKHVEIRQYEHTPVVKIQSWTDVPRGVPLYETLFTFQNYPVEDTLWQDADPKGMQIESAKTTTKSHYPLAVRIGTGATILIRITYDSQRFTDASMTRMLGHFHSLLEGLGMDPARQLSQLDLLSPTEEQLMLSGWTNVAAESGLPEESQATLA
jgi:non-ribosomal peptide synthetase component F